MDLIQVFTFLKTVSSDKNVEFHFVLRDNKEKKEPEIIYIIICDDIKFNESGLDLDELIKKFKSKFEYPGRDEAEKEFIASGGKIIPMEFSKEKLVA